MKNGRKAWIETISELAEKDPRVIMVIGDVGFTFIEPFRQRFPNQFLNAGAAEQTMMGLATGLSRAGWKPYVYTMIPFIVFRPYEQVRNDICYGNSNVKLFGVQGSQAYAFLGHSHNIYDDEDKKLLDHLPNINTYYPEAEDEVRTKMLEEYDRSGPAYFRI